MSEDDALETLEGAAEDDKGGTSGKAAGAFAFAGASMIQLRMRGGREGQVRSCWRHTGEDEDDTCRWS